MEGKHLKYCLMGKTTSCYVPKRFFYFQMSVPTLTVTLSKCVLLTGKLMLTDRCSCKCRAVGSVAPHITAPRQTTAQLDLEWNGKPHPFHSPDICFDISLRLWVRLVSFLSCFFCTFSLCTVSSPLSLSLSKKKVKVRPLAITLFNMLQGQRCV